jgi:hypothetical protein
MHGAIPPRVIYLHCMVFNLARGQLCIYEEMDEVQMTQQKTENHCLVQYSTEF